MKLRRLGFILIIALATVVALQYLDTETAIERCYRECELCGLRRGEVAVMIQNILTSRLTREEQIERYESTAREGDNVAPCLPCVEAVLDVAEKEQASER